jgi:hypothetical protein
MWVSEALLKEARGDERLSMLEEPRPIDFDASGSLL